MKKTNCMNLKKTFPCWWSRVYWKGFGINFQCFVFRVCRRCRQIRKTVCLHFVILLQAKSLTLETNMGCREVARNKDLGEHRHVRVPFLTPRFETISFLAKVHVKEFFFLPSQYEYETLNNLFRDQD